MRTATNNFSSDYLQKAFDRIFKEGSLFSSKKKGAQATRSCA